jgi:four helix bundle protein
MSVSAKTYEELRAWQSVRAFKVGVYALTEQKPLSSDFKLCDQLRDAAASAQSHIAEGFGRFDPRVSEILCVGHSMRSLYAPQTEARAAERRDPGADPC